VAIDAKGGNGKSQFTAIFANFNSRRGLKLLKIAFSGAADSGLGERKYRYYDGVFKSFA
jgi:hypothetical protein